MTEERIKYIKENFIVDIIRNDNGYVHAYIHNKNGEYECSFHIQTSPEMLFYYGDLGTFVFKRHDQENMLRFFNRATPDMRYWEEKCIAGNIKQYDADTARRSFLEYFASELPIDYDDNTPDSELYDKIEHLFDRYDEYQDNEDEDADFSDVEEKGWLLDDKFSFDDAYDALDSEYYYGTALDFLYDKSISCEYFEIRAYTHYFDRCLWNLAIFSGKILELVNEHRVWES